MTAALILCDFSVAFNTIDDEILIYSLDHWVA